VEGLKAAIEEYDKIDTEAARELDKRFPAWKLARTTHTKRKTEAADIGTRAHKWIEQYVRACIIQTPLVGNKPNEYPLPESEPDIKDITDQFVKWVTDNKVTFLESEKRLYSREYWYAGTCDLVFLKNGKKHVGDIKTSSGIYGREYFFQMAGYQIALEEMGQIGEKNFFANTIIRCGKDGSFEVKDSFDLESDKAGFLAALRLYRELNK
jgi:ATP-dependent exoDNAse (exonuclease V) beta subunit